MIGGITLFPQSASTQAGELDPLFFALVFFSFALGSFLAFLVIYYCVKYRRGSAASRSGRRRRNLGLEIGWTSASLIIAFGMFAWGAELYMQREYPPPDAIHVLGVGKQWMWKFEHAGGQREINALHVPVGRAVVVDLSSEDVIHSFFVPAFRVKQDAVPGMVTRVWFEATKPGTYHLFCSEYCGSSHSHMTGEVVALEPRDFAAWLDNQPAGISIVQEGEELFRSLGCSGCHEGAGPIRAPSLHGVFGKPVPLADGTTVIADRGYIRDSILLPKKQVVAGYEPIMPSFSGLIDEAEMSKLIAFIQSLSGPDAQE